jgi:hypothetical protein
LRQNDRGDPVDRAEEVAGGLVVSGGDGPVLLEFGEEVFDQVPSFVQYPVVVTLHFARWMGGDDDLRSLSLHRLDDPCTGVVRSVSEQGTDRQVRQQGICTFQIRGLACGQVKRHRIAQCIDHRVDLAAQSAAAASDGVRAPPFAPALC